MIRMLAFAAAILAIAQTTAAQPSSMPPATEPTATPPAAAPTAPPAAPADVQAAPAAPTEPPAAPPAQAPAQPAPAVAPPQPVPAVAQPIPPPPTPPQRAASAAPAQPPPRGRRLYTWGSVGTTFAYGQTYASANLGVGYLMRSGITPNVEASYAFGNSPTVWTLRPGVTWFLPVPVLSPYVGAYMTHWFVTDRGDENGIGGRAGFSLGRMISLGVTYDRALNCSQNCESWSPQVSAGFSM